ncbi:hypothetical protein EVAR_91214_1 [Eumeta japonica]|uniref:Uncharacterized protein n=1 Tax=Eumeta variegata TaxID=151549 RepID=A0A4C2AHD5_EUMVA|nr:hypothetical protein EVAR_91214_1 [Eumeta japonica]
MYSRELASAKQVEPVNQVLGTVIECTTRSLPTPARENQTLNTDVNSLTGIDSDSRMSPAGCKLTHRSRFWLEEEPLQDVNSPHRNRFWLEEEPCRMNRFCSRRSPAGCAQGIDSARGGALQDVNSLTGIDSARGGALQDVSSLTGIDSGSRRSPAG